MEVIRDAGGAAPEVPGYDVGRLLGRGGTAAVWLVTERSTGREFALKCFDAGGDATDDAGGTRAQEAEEALRREVRILSALDHDHLLRVHTVLRLRGPWSGPESRDALGLVLDYAPGGSVADARGGPRPAGSGRNGDGPDSDRAGPGVPALPRLHPRRCVSGQRVVHGARETAARRSGRGADGGRRRISQRRRDRGLFRSGPGGCRPGGPPARARRLLAGGPGLVLPDGPAAGPGRPASAAAAAGPRRAGGAGRRAGGRARRGPAAASLGRGVGRRGLSQRSGGARGPLCHCPSDGSSAVAHPPRRAPQRPEAPGRTASQWFRRWHRRPGGAPTRSAGSRFQSCSRRHPDRTRQRRPVIRRPPLPDAGRAAGAAVAAASSPATRPAAQFQDFPGRGREARHFAGGQRGTRRTGPVPGLHRVPALDSGRGGTHDPGGSPSAKLSGTAPGRRPGKLSGEAPWPQGAVGVAGNSGPARQ